MMREQKSVWLFLLLITVELIIWASLAAARPFRAQAQAAQLQQANSTPTKGMREVVRLGSRPPNCEHKCGGCEPCMAIQVPTTTDQLRIQYANYEPEGWKCKCGSAFYNP